jgi:hypothetical protein
MLKVVAIRAGRSGGIPAQNIPADKFEALVESQKPPTVTALAEMVAAKCGPAHW